MKITKSMFYQESPEAHELYLCCICNRDVYTQIQATKKVLQKKYNAGIYDHNAAVTAWYYVANAEARVYNKEFGYMFTVTQRYTAAIKLESYYYNFIVDNEEI